MEGEWDHYGGRESFREAWRAGGVGRPPDGEGELLSELLSSVGQRVGDLLDIVATLRRESLSTAGASNA